MEQMIKKGVGLTIKEFIYETNGKYTLQSIYNATANLQKMELIRSAQLQGKEKYFFFMDNVYIEHKRLIQKRIFELVAKETEEEQTKAYFERLKKEKESGEKKEGEDGN
jgi:hypothetical protein